MRVGYFGDTLLIPLEQTALQVSLQHPVSEKSVQHFYSQLSCLKVAPLVNAINSYRKTQQLDDWLFYQLIRRTAQQLSPKAEDYERYTLYKWFLLNQSGFDARLAFSGSKLLIYVYSTDNIYDIPLFKKDDKQYVCLNIHDYGHADFEKDPLHEIQIDAGSNVKPFSYRLSRIPDFKTESIDEKELSFSYRDNEYNFHVKIDPQMQALFNNYPSVDFESYFNIPLSRVTYNSLIPVLKRKMKGMRLQVGIDYLMRFTRHAFLYETDQENFGMEKRLSPQQTIMNNYSDCDDRVALFYYLVKEIYDLPMIVMLYPEHVTIAVALPHPVGDPIIYKGKKFYVCEPTPQPLELPIGKLMPSLSHTRFEVAFEYDPAHK